MTKKFSFSYAELIDLLGIGFDIIIPNTKGSTVQVRHCNDTDNDINFYMAGIVCWMKPDSDNDVYFTEANKSDADYCLSRLQYYLANDGIKTIAGIAPDEPKPYPEPTASIVDVPKPVPEPAISEAIPAYELLERRCAELEAINTTLMSENQVLKSDIANINGQMAVLDRIVFGDSFTIRKNATTT